MPRRVNTFVIGLFVLVCGGLGLVALLWLGASHIFEESKTYVTYFAESIKGLQEDAIVNYRGVAIGRVTSVGVAPDGRLIEVVMNLRPDFKVDKGLAIRLREQGLTGLRFLEIDTAPPDVDRVTPVLNFTPPYPVIPSYPSEIQQLKNAFEDIHSKIVSLDLQGLTERWKEVGDTINRVFGGADLETTLKNVRRSTTRLDAVLAKFERAFTEKDLETIVQSTQETLRRLNRSLETLEAALDSGRKASEIVARRLEEIPPGFVSETTRKVDRILSETQSLVAQWDEQTTRTLTLLNQNLYSLKVLMDELTVLTRRVKEEPSRILFGPHPEDPLEENSSESGKGRP